MERGEYLKVEIGRLCDEVSFFKQEVHTSKIYLNLSSKNCTTNYVYFHVHLLYLPPSFAHFKTHRKHGGTRAKIIHTIYSLNLSFS